MRPLVPPGFLLYCIIIITYIFAHPTVRKRAYKFFWMSHQLYIMLYFLCLVHGLARITSPPKFWIFFVLPGTVYILDKAVSLRRCYMELDILETVLLPSDVIKIKFYRPPNFKFLSGQYVRASCTAIKPEEFHSLTVTSAPHEDFLSFHIKAVGSWTWKLRNHFDPHNRDNGGKRLPAEADTDEDGEVVGSPPRMRLQGPFGGGNQDWYKFEVRKLIETGSRHYFFLGWLKENFYLQLRFSSFFVLFSLKLFKLFRLIIVIIYFTNLKYLFILNLYIYINFFLRQSLYPPSIPIY